MWSALEGLKSALSAIPPAYRDKLSDPAAGGMRTVSCSACQAKNRVPVAWQGEPSRCGQCHHPLNLPATDPLSLQRALDRWKAPPVVAIVGRFSSGKSRLINALLGEEILPYDVAPTTAKLTRLAYGKRRGLILTDQEGNPSRQPLAKLPKLVDQTQLDHEIADRVIELMIQLPSPLLLSGLMLVDTPGLDNPEDAHRREHNAQTEKALQEATACLLVFDPPGLKDQTLELLRRVVAVTHRVVFVLNKSDLLMDPEDLEATLEETCEILQQECPEVPPRVFVVSALWELRHEVANPDDLEWYGPPRHDLSALRRYLLRFLHGNEEALDQAVAGTACLIASLEEEIRQQPFRPITAERLVQHYAHFQQQVKDRFVGFALQRALENARQGQQPPHAALQRLGLRSPVDSTLEQAVKGLKQALSVAATEAGHIAYRQGAYSRAAGHLNLAQAHIDGHRPEALDYLQWSIEIAARCDLASQKAALLKRWRNDPCRCQNELNDTLTSLASALAAVSPDPEADLSAVAQTFPPYHPLGEADTLIWR